MALMDAFKKKMGKGSSKEGSTPKFADDGEPSMAGAEPRGGGGGADDAGDSDVYASDMPGHGGMDNESIGGGGYDDIEDSAADDLGDLLGCAPEDREEMKAALKTYVSACFSKLMAEQDSGGDEVSPTEGDSEQE